MMRRRVVQPGTIMCSCPRDCMFAQSYDYRSPQVCMIERTLNMKSNRDLLRAGNIEAFLYLQNHHRFRTVGAGPKGFGPRDVFRSPF